MSSSSKLSQKILSDDFLLKGNSNFPSTSISNSTSSVGAPPRRIKHRRRASQPAFSFAHSANSSTSTSSNYPSIPFGHFYPTAVEAYAVSAATQTDSSDESTSASGTEEEDDSEEEAFWNGRSRRADGLEYLDLSLSLPFRLATARSQMLIYLTELETRVRNLYSNSHPQDPLNKSIQTQLSKFHSQLEAFKEDLRKLVSLLPSPPQTLFFPIRAPQQLTAKIALAPSVALAFAKTGPQSLAAEWDRLSNAIQLHLPDTTFPLSLNLAGETSLNLLEKMQIKFEALQDSVSGLTLRGFVSSASDDGKKKLEGDGQISGIPSSPSFARRLELRMSSFSKDASVRAQEVGAKAKETARDTEETLYRAALELAGAAGRGKRALIEYRHLPTVWKNNEHILSGYRFIPFQEWPTLIKSTFELHNETWNIQTHLWGILIVLPLFWPSKGLDPDTTPMDRLVQTLYLCAAIKCLALSVSWHVMAGCSDIHIFEGFACCDFVGIAWLIAASVWTLVYNAFYCQPNLAFFYSSTTFVVGLVGAILPWAKWFNTREAKPYRIATFLTMCFTALAPFTHAAFEHGFVKSFVFFSPIIPSLAFYVGGLVFYALQWPEKRWPGKYDLGANSHVIWHIAIVLAILMHYRAALQFHANRFEFSCAASNPPVSGLSGAASKLVEAVGGLHGVEGLMRADEKVHEGRIALGKLGHGAVGRAWDSMMKWIQTW